ncbi:MAG: hypothetical protein AAB678_02265 [Patescibacteria group bacterium]
MKSMNKIGLLLASIAILMLAVPAQAATSFKPGYVPSGQKPYTGLQQEEINLSEKILDTLHNHGEKITSLAYPVLPKDKNIIFVSTREELQGGKVLNSVYTYHLTKGTLWRFYAEIVGYKNSPAGIRTVAMDGNKLIIIRERERPAAVQCAMSLPWTLSAYNGRVFYLDVTKKVQTLKIYTIAKDVLKKGEADRSKCAASIK